MRVITNCLCVFCVYFTSIFAQSRNVSCHFLCQLFFLRNCMSIPATESDVSFYSRIAGVSTCVARTSGVPFSTAVDIAAETLTEVVMGHHGGQTQAAVLTREEAKKMFAAAAAANAAQFCASLVPADVLPVVQPPAQQMIEPAQSVPSLFPQQWQQPSQ